jgi:hypothetical protein
MSKQTINIGASPNDGTGTPLRTSFDYTNQNFTELYTALGGGVGLPGATTQVIFNDGGTNLAGDAGLVYNKTTDALTVAGLVTAGSATITGDLTVDTSTLKVDSTNNRVGIGTATPVSSLQVLDGDITATTANVFGGFNGTRQTIPTSQGTQLSRLHFSAYSTGTTYAQGASIQSYTDAAWSASSSPATLSFYTTPSASVTPSERMRIEAAGDVKILTGNLVMTTSGKGIDFSATASGSGTMTSELLADYEEGTFTPTVIGSTTAGVGVYSAQSGIYTKVGRQVTVQIYVSWSAHTGTGNIFVGNLPFTNASNYWSASVGYANNIALTAGSVMTAYVEIFTSYITLWQYPTGGGAATEVPIDATGGIMLSASYNV